jgi:hypothetical protein
MKIDMSRIANRSKLLINILILLVILLIISIVWTGGFEINIIGKQISCKGLTNPILILCFLILFRICYAIGWVNSLILFIALLLSTGLSEAFLRILDTPMTLPSLKNMTQPSDVLEYELVPLLNDRLIKINSHGLRDREHGWMKPPGVRRLLGIGDSFTFGYNVDVKDCYLKQLERLLNQGQKRWDVINAGVSGYNMWQYLAYFTHYGYRYEPDLVTIGIFFDDFYGDPTPGRKKSFHGRYRSLSSIRLINFGRNCIEFLKFKYRYLLDSGWLKSIEQRREYIRNSKYYPLLKGKADSQVYEKFELRLKNLNHAAKEHGACVLVIFIPDIVQLNNPELQVVNGILKNICQRYNVGYLDMTSIFEKFKDIQKLYLLPGDAHTSPAGHGIIARETEKWITSKAGIKEM